MNVCIINNIYPPYHRGGAEQVVVKTVEGLLAHGHRVVIITGCPDGDYIEKDGNLVIYRFRPRNLFFYTKAHQYGGIRRFFWHLIDIGNGIVAKRVRRILEKEKPDVVHTHNLMGLSFLIPIVIRTLHVHHVHHVHDVQLVEPSAMILKEKEQSRRYTGIPTQLYTLIMKRLMGSPDVVISPSQFLLDFYRKRGFFQRSNCVVVQNPTTFMPHEVLGEPISHESFRFLYVGQIETHKGVFLLLEAFAYVQKIYSTCELHIVGSGSVLDALKQRVAGRERIVVYGKKEREHLPHIFHSTDVTVVPSLCYENSPTVIFESFSCHVPVLASDIEGVAELIREGENGITFQTGNVASLKEKMIWCLTHKEQIDRMRTKTHESSIGLSREAYVAVLTSLYTHSVQK